MDYRSCVSAAGEETLIVSRQGKYQMNPFSFLWQATISSVPGMRIHGSILWSLNVTAYRSAFSSISEPTFSTSLPKPSIVLQPDKVNNANTLTNTPINKLFICSSSSVVVIPRTPIALGSQGILPYAISVPDLKGQEI
jgi:hypothetical protein